jgi:peptide/nickel transport system substrate-binding protein
MHQGETMQKDRIRWRRFTLLVVATIVLSACSSTAGPAATSAPTAAVAITDTPIPTSGSTPAPQNTLRVSSFPIAQTDPAQISANGEVLIANHVYDYLVDIDAQNQIRPRLATAWRHSQDGLTYTFTLASGVTFHDGSPFGAKDVVWTYNRLRNTSGLPTADLYENIVDIQATGDLTVTFTLSETNPFFLYDLSDNHALMMNEGTTDPTHFNGTGPFKVVDYVAADRLTMTANKDYFIKDLPYLDGLEIIFFSDQTASADALRSGQIDLTMDLSTPLYVSLQERNDLIAQDVATNAFALVRLRTDEPPGNDPRVIQALKLATDREAVFQVVQQGYGAVGNDTPIGPIFKTYYTEQYALPARDPQAAKDHLAQAGYPNGLDLTLNLLNTFNFPDLASVIKEQWAEAGINVTISTLPESVYYGQGEWLEAKLGITGWGHRPYPQFYLDVMLTCGAKWNETRFCDPQFDQLVETAGSTLDEQTRINAYHEIQRILIERGPLLVPYFFAQYGVISDRFEGFHVNPFPGRSDLRVVRPR